MKTILTINYSQTGQLDEIISHFLKPFAGEEYLVERIKIKPTKPFTFPWTTGSFFDAMPETVLEEPIDLQVYTPQQDRYDLVILGYQPWFLSPSLPTSSLLQQEKFKQILKDTPVVTIIGARNMWLNAQESVKKRIREAGGKLVGNIPLIDKNSNLVSALTIMHWMFGGKKDRKWNILPIPGVAEKDILSMDKYGKIVRQSLENGNFAQTQFDVLSLGEIKISTNIMFIEMRAKKIFYIWANLIKKKGTDLGKRKVWVKVFQYYLVIALFAVSPIVLLIFNILLRPFIFRSLKKQKNYFSAV